ncbi:MAG: hypothetical protein ACWA44_05995 [Thiotrichales bacterium]
MTIKPCYPVLIAAIFITSLTACGKKEEAAPAVSFAADVAPIIKKNCLECHVANGPGHVASGLLMADVDDPSKVSYDNLMKGTRFGPIVVAGDPVSSALNRLVEGRADPSIRMPHGKEELSDEAKATLHEWVAQGAQNN